MNSAQKKLVVMWSGIGLLLVLAVANHRWVLDNWDWLGWPALIAILMVATFGGKEMKGWVEPGKTLNDFLDTYPLFKVWVVFYGSIIILTSVVGLARGFEFHESPGFWLFMGSVPLFLPLMVIAEYQHYKRLETQSNRFNKDASR